MHDNIAIVQQLHAAGQTIIIHTARRMRTHGGNVGAVIADIGAITIQTLKDFNIPYDELYFGKPYADVYVDDLAVNALDDPARDIGWVGSKAARSKDMEAVSNMPSRSSTTILIQDNTVMKCSNSGDLEGEIFFYKSMPESIRKYFPAYLHANTTQDERSARLDMSLVHGVPFSQLITHMVLTRSRLLMLISLLRTVHDCKCSSSAEAKKAMYLNYAVKTRERLDQYSESSIMTERASAAAKSIVGLLSRYESDDKGTWVDVIHGNPVLSNCLIDGRNEIKLIDMKGRLGKVLSLGGDENYDWAKILQSLYGYDFYVRGKVPTDQEESYLADLRECFFGEICDREDSKISRDDLKGLTAGLFLSLPPCHGEGSTVGQLSVDRACRLMEGSD
mmetsp:Transcript_21144/g.54965  ORF Transcript_21144/g.54965 Transcript_21144/m.54965 type:complete len:391 (+) Transcript_21144:1100-2272(+)